MKISRRSVAKGYVPAFPIQKPDLGLRPVWHQWRDRVEAHILACFLACVPWKAPAGIAMVGVALAARKGIEIHIRCVSQPTEHQAIPPQRLSPHMPAKLGEAEM